MSIGITYVDSCPTQFNQKTTQSTVAGRVKVIDELSEAYGSICYLDEIGILPLLTIPLLGATVVVLSQSDRCVLT
ncbi:MAG: hypothetical protein WA631_01660, partial [Nitrososphaeraceae archaeon]